MVNQLFSIGRAILFGQDVKLACQFNSFVVMDFSESFLRVRT